MNKSIVSIIKIFTITLVTLVVACFIYALMIKSKSGTQNYNIPSIIIGSIIFFILGFLASNHHQKRGIFTAIGYSLIVIVVILLSLLFTDNKINFMLILKYIIFVISSVIGGVLGVNVKKFI